MPSPASLRPALAVVTGASSGIGQAFSRLLAARGCELLLVARREDRLRQLADELSAQHAVRTKILPLDLSRAKSADELFAAATELGPVRVLVNSAGLGVYGPFAEQEPTHHEDALSLNVVTMTMACHAFVRHMQAHGEPSYICNVASLAAFSTPPSFAVYGASKTYVRVFSETLAHELRGTSIRISCLCPGGTWTEFMEHSGTEITRLGRTQMMSAEAVARAGLDGMLAGKRIVIPGLLNRVGARLGYHAPAWLRLRAADLIMKRATRRVPPR